MGYYRYFYKPAKGSTSDLLDRYSRLIGENFTVFQVGANDGITHDPIHKFIKRDNWNGVLLEPQKQVYDEYLRHIYKKNKGIVTLNAAVGFEDGEYNLYKVGFTDERWATGLASFDKSVLESSFENGYVQEQAKKHGIEVPEAPEDQISVEKIASLSPKTILRTYNIDIIHLLQIDVEGFDFEVIKMFDVAKTKPGMIIFESSHLSEEDYKDCLQHLESNGYITKKRGRNSVALGEQHQELLDFFS